ncbi:SAM-dependent methyltransferase [Catenovulum sp. SM1970]|uniref:tRNA (guanine(46)-N(7))-methyltransferase TrmB n=1 Tax=Marinifaba aquimaris TaxID=2741323 RepID=UPI0015738878|nr:SAM-dependent methyltransferase [Marinifaba aquimaris]NTS75663.1 SAM-dependent methyltransferase [Marinifaba aquimaris]
MSEGNSRVIESNQDGIHEDLTDIVNKHFATKFLKPFAEHTKQAFAEVEAQLASKSMPIIFDSCCGVGDSSRALANLYPNHWVVGIDKSADRLSRERDNNEPDNLILARADLNDFYRLAVQANWQVDKHFILYPNPWPKSAHVKRRWHGSAVFPEIIKLGKTIELRSNWKLYLEEFAYALKLAGMDSELKPYQFETAITPFEQKYHNSGQPLWQLTAELYN